VPLAVSLDTVKSPVSHLLGKLGAANRTEAVIRARQLRRRYDPADLSGDGGSSGLAGPKMAPIAANKSPCLMPRGGSILGHLPGRVVLVR
jgi:hypothetical protein